MRQMFVLRVKEKEAELKDSEKEVCLTNIPPSKEERYIFFHVLFFAVACQIRQIEKGSRRRET